VRSFEEGWGGGPWPVHIGPTMNRKKKKRLSSNTPSGRKKVERKAVPSLGGRKKNAHRTPCQKHQSILNWIEKRGGGIRKNISLICLSKKKKKNLEGFPPKQGRGDDLKPNSDFPKKKKKEKNSERAKKIPWFWERASIRPLALQEGRARLDVPRKGKEKIPNR